LAGSVSRAVEASVVSIAHNLQRNLRLATQHADSTTHPKATTRRYMRNSGGGGAPRDHTHKCVQLNEVSLKGDQ
jgi:hypothetical protein